LLLLIEILLLKLVSFIVNGPDSEKGQDDGRQKNNDKENGKEFLVLDQN
jgi:hypothetical protein